MTNPDSSERTMPDETSAAPRAKRPARTPKGALPPLSPTAPAARPAARVSDPTGRSMALEGLHAYYGATHAIKGVSLRYAPNEVTAMIGPSGCGKSTVLRCLNRMHEEIPGARAEGRVTLDDFEIYGDGVDVTSVRRAIGMVFQKPNPFPTMSIFDNVAAGLKLAGIKGTDTKHVVERSLRGAGLWDEVKDRLSEPGIGLSGGQQQRLCIARTIAVQPEVILMDEPCSALDPIATLKVEELITELKRDFTIIIVTHNMQQAARVSDTTAFFYLGELVEHAPTEKLFSTPANARTEEYVTGKFS
jgi:phosphate transport system ATP-binding protein